jgi:hypothetical protein
VSHPDGLRPADSTPGRRRRVALVLGLALALTAVGAVGTVGEGGQVLVAVAADTGERLLVVPVEDGTPVTLAYTHSVERTPVRDRYVVRDGALVMTRMEFESYGWGLPADADVELVNGTFVAERNGSYAELTVVPGRLAGHRLIIGDRSVDLVALADGRAVTLAVELRSGLAIPRSHHGQP